MSVKLISIGVSKFAIAGLSLLAAFALIEAVARWGLGLSSPFPFVEHPTRYFVVGKAGALYLERDAVRSNTRGQRSLAGGLENILAEARISSLWRAGHYNGDATNEISVE